MDSERKLVTVRMVSEIRPIDKADRIELAVVEGGWQCVVKKGEFSPGDIGVYFEIDSFLPMSNPIFEFLRKDSRVWDGNLGTRLRTIRLRGSLSQGLLLPMKDLQFQKDVGKAKDLAKFFGVVKWEREIPEKVEYKKSWINSTIRFLVPNRYIGAVFAYLYGVKKLQSSWPPFLRKTDEERIQNIISEKAGSIDLFEVTGKMDGSSMTVYVNKGIFGVCSRNRSIAPGEGGNFNKIVDKYNLRTLLPSIMGAQNIAIQGELCGPNIQGNYEELDDHDFFVFRVWDIDRQCYMSPAGRDNVLEQLRYGGVDLKKVPFIQRTTLAMFKTVNDFLDLADGPSLKAKNREGVVFQKVDGTDSFKVISNTYLLETGN